MCFQIIMRTSSDMPRPNLPCSSFLLLCFLYDPRMCNFSLLLCVHYTSVKGLPCIWDHGDYKGGKRHSIPELLMLIALTSSLVCLLPPEVLELGLCPSRRLYCLNILYLEVWLHLEKGYLQIFKFWWGHRMSPNSLWLHLYQKGNLGKDRHKHTYRKKLHDAGGRTPPDSSIMERNPDDWQQTTGRAKRHNLSQASQRTKSYLLISDSQLLTIHCISYTVGDILL